MSLEARLKRDLAATGPISVAEYMARALLDPVDGYYTTRAPLGATGDFVTAPEISQMFGEMLGLCLAQTWIDQGAPTHFTLAELGPGRGTLMADILRAGRAVPGFLDAADIVLVEVSPTLRQAQEEALAEFVVRWQVQPDWPDRPLYLVANEFFDALPVRQFIRDGQRWRERQVGLVDDALAFGLGPAQPQPALVDRLEDTKDGDVVEICPQLAPIVAPIADTIERQGGAALILDYGDWKSVGDTLQAVRGHEKVTPLDTPGAADLTAHVDFAAVAQAAEGARHTRLCGQGLFLERLGITARAQVLAERLSGSARQNHIAAHRRLTHPDEMGTLFKVMGLYPTTATPPPGLTE